MTHESARSPRSLVGPSAVAIGTLAVGLIAWLAVVDRWLPMPGDGGTSVSSPGGPEAGAIAAGPEGVMAYLLVWGVMMVAMMFPSTAPLFGLYVRTIEGRSPTGKAVRSVTFVGTYALVWTATGIAPLAVAAVAPVREVATRHPSALLGGLLLVVAAYQLSSLKHRCLRRCRTPLGFLLGNHRPGVVGAAAMSARYSLSCVGCCWALLALIVAVGSMDLGWMVVLTTVLSIERIAGWGEGFARGVGVAAGFGGVGLLVGAAV